jgi:putative hydroxymethylpyrimidine transport system substrate-binding protein
MPMRPLLRRRGALLAASLLATVLCAGCGDVHTQLALGRARPLTVAIGSLPDAFYAALYAGRADRDFALGAIALRISARADPLAALESGSANVAIAPEPDVLAARARGEQLVAIGAFEPVPLAAIVSLSSRPLTTAGALAGHTVALPADPLAAAELETVLADAQVIPSSVHRVILTGPLADALRDGRADATLGEPWPAELATLTATHHQASVLAIQRAGVPTYAGLAIVVRVREARYDADLLRAFLQSLIRGERAVAAHPAATARLLHGVEPALGVAYERAVLASLLTISAPAGANRPFGYQSPTAWVAFAAWMAAHHLIANADGAGIAITDEFLPGQGEQIITTS